MKPQEIKQILTEFFKVAPITTEIYRKGKPSNGTDWFRVSASGKATYKHQEFKGILEGFGKSDLPKDGNNFIEFWRNHRLEKDESIYDINVEDIFIHPDYNTCLAAAKEHRGWLRDWNLFEINEFESSLGKVWIIWD